MICLGIALRVSVCSWVTDASFGFWVGFLVSYIFQPFVEALFRKRQPLLIKTSSLRSNIKSSVKGTNTHIFYRLY